MAEAKATESQGPDERRALRARYQAVKNLINETLDDVEDLKQLQVAITEVESLHEHVRKPREQVSDAEALGSITNKLLTTVRSQIFGLTPSDFVFGLVKKFSRSDRGELGPVSVNRDIWNDTGFTVSGLFRGVPGCCTMLGKMNTELKHHKNLTYRKRRRTQTSQIVELIHTEAEAENKTDIHILTMLNILAERRSVRLDHLVLNRISFAQTVENIFALSFLVKDGRAQISLNETMTHLVSLKDAPIASEITSGDVSYHHFVFRFGFTDWTDRITKLRDQLIKKMTGDPCFGYENHAKIDLVLLD